MLVKSQACAQTSGRLVSYYYLFCHNANIMKGVNLAQLHLVKLLDSARYPTNFFFMTATGMSKYVSSSTVSPPCPGVCR